MAKSHIAMIDGYDVGAHLSAATPATGLPSVEDVQQMRFDEAKKRLQNLVPINDALYSALTWYKVQAAASYVLAPWITLLLAAYPVDQVTWAVDQWHTQALALMSDDSYLYDVVADEARWQEFSDVMDRLVQQARDTGLRMKQTSLIDSAETFAKRYPRALKDTIKYAINAAGEVVKPLADVFAPFVPYLIAGGLLFALVTVAPMFKRSRA